MPLFVLAGLVARHLLTAGGAVVVANGIAGQSEVEQATGAIVTLVGIVWSAYKNYKLNKPQ